MYKVILVWVSKSPIIFKLQTPTLYKKSRIDFYEKNANIPALY